MQHQVLDIRAGAAGTTAKLYTYIRDESPEMEAHRRPAVVICPGGGYGMTSDREAEPVALKFLEKGFQCFIPVSYTHLRRSAPRIRRKNRVRGGKLNKPPVPELQEPGVSL